MDIIIDTLNMYHLYLTLSIVVLLIITLVLLIKTNKQMKHIQKKYEKFMLKQDLDLEQLLIHYAERVKNSEEVQEQLRKELDTMKERMKYAIQKVGVVRYNAYDKTGGDLSFALALLDEKNDGAILNGIYGREACYIYGKSIEKGECKHNLSDEEIEAIKLAKENNQSL